MCTDLFGEQYTAVAVQRSIDKINQLYGGIDYYHGTNVVIPNGSIDPWHALGKYTSNDSSVVMHLIEGTAHCAEMYPARPQDPPDLVATRKLIEENIAKWLKTEPITKETTRATSTTPTTPASTARRASTAGPVSATASTQPTTTTTKSAPSTFIGEELYRP
ncbi:hypothetical protein ANCDUO_27281 [Ancylostoma duodenale]|uniref:Serine carboxypeptidase S28 n=1 Tax=Ancylostoma duodenale TaxID=51022 RepID=A0A0C2F2C2_9BILA|nr:hypothetical protein ANCDUO_27281 [Ancylostoma duodenale]